MTRQVLHHRFKVEVAIRDVDRDDSVRIHVSKIKGHRLTRQQMDWNGIATESIERQQVELMSLSSNEFLLQ